MAVQDFTGKNIQNTYQRVVQTDGTNTADGTGSLLPISFDGNNVIISGSLVAHSYVVSESVTAISSGSTIFGNSPDDIHQITGSLLASSSILADKYQLHLGSQTVNAIRTEGNNIAFGPDSGEVHTTVISGSVLRLHAAGDIITDIGGDDFRINKTDTEFFRFNLETNPIIETTGNLTIDPTGGNTRFDSHITASGNISASGNILGNLFASNGNSVAFSNDGVLSYGNSADITLLIGTNIKLGSSTSQHVTASGNISSSGNLIGIIDGGTF